MDRRDFPAMSAPQDCTELERRIQELQLQLLQAQKLSTIGSLASSMTHEFNNILTTIINYAKLGLRHKDNATREKALDKILNAGQRASRITTGLLSYARRGNDRRESTDLIGLAKEVLVLVEKDLQIHRVRLQTSFDSQPVMADVNASQLQQVLLNLIVNARQAMETGGQLTVTVRAAGEGSLGEISVRDTGRGIPAETLRKIFDPYFTTKTADAQGQGGTGLGLSLAREVLEAHHGRIRVESTVGQGTTFILKLPLTRNTGKPATASPRSWTETPPAVVQKAG
jgi:signal transduction histidine kinase